MQNMHLCSFKTEEEIWGQRQRLKANKDIEVVIA